MTNFRITITLVSAICTVFLSVMVTAGVMAGEDVTVLSLFTTGNVCILAVRLVAFEFNGPGAGSTKENPAKKGRGSVGEV